MPHILIITGFAFVSAGLNPALHWWETASLIVGAGLCYIGGRNERRE